ncbi:uncharacterized protein ARMOST_16238 [Armillaria ostoyae]|uniref:Uncharacterized protein n=1 Tax=Armillaria ostoyae TaxID=47428 RepID=A0A284RVP0_ARMOS|nr:uncharacterized protein ARMOST_16238 [Armillaria ostoyae]
MVAHPKATDILQDVYADRNDKDTESSSKDSRWSRTAQDLNIPQCYNGPDELINSLTQYSAPHMYLPETRWHAIAQFQVSLTVVGALHRLNSTFWRHVKMLQEKPIPWDFGRPLIDALQPEPVTYQLVMQGQIILVIILADQKLSRSGLGVYTQLFAELYAASRCNTDYDLDEDEMRNDSLRVHGLLFDRSTTQFSFFSYDPTISAFQVDENLYVNASPVTLAALRDMIRVIEKLLSILVYAYNELLDNRHSYTSMVPKEDQVHRICTKTQNTPRSLSDSLDEAIRYAKSATETLKHPSNQDALKQGLNFLHESVRVLPIRGEFDSSWSRYTMSLRNEGFTWREKCGRTQDYY